MLTALGSTPSVGLRSIKVTVNGRILDAKKGETLIDLCDRYNIKIPRLCYHPNLPPRASCRVCLVEQITKNWRGLTPACVLKVFDGLTVETKSPAVVKHVRNNLGLLLASHDEHCSQCVANHRCEFRDYVYSNQASAPYREPASPQSVDHSTNSIVLDTSKCVLCGRCIRACEVFAGQSAIHFGKRGSHMSVQPAGGDKLSNTSCVKCGQCTLYCPVGAITERSQVQECLKVLSTRPRKLLIAQTAPAVRVAISEALGLPPGTDSTGKMISALRKLGFDKVYDTNWSADLTILEEATELVSRLSNPKAALPMFTSCCPAWINYVEQSRPSFIPNLSTCRSPQGMLSSCIKNVLPKSLGVAAEDIYTVSIMPCTAKKDEIERPQLRTASGLKETDMSLTVRELVEMIKLSGINYAELEDSQFDVPYGDSTGAAVIFAASGGVMEAAARTAFETVTGKKLTNVVIDGVRGLKQTKICTLDLEGSKLKVAVVHGINEAGKFLDKIENKDPEVRDVKFIEVMACPGGCVNGGGTPRLMNKEHMEKRVKGIYSLDDKSKIRKSHENPAIIQVYKDFFGKPNSHKSHELLHTHYTNRKPKII